MAKLSIAIMAHPSREKFFPYLQERLGDIPISVDTGKGIWDNCKRAWQASEIEKAEYHLVLQDDAIICHDFRKKAEEILSVGHRAYSFYFGNRQRFRRLAQKGLKEGHILGGLNWGLAVCLRADLIKQMIRFGDRTNLKQDDARIQKFLSKNKIKVYYPMPSLIDHRTGEQSLVNDKGRGRKAWFYIDNEN